MQKDSKTGLARAAFARRLKLGETRGRHLADTGEVAKQSAVNCGLLSSKSSHLAVIQKAPINDWTWLVQSLLEIGLHALQYVQVSSGGRGQTGGLSQYARGIGKESCRPELSRYRQSAEVYEATQNLCDITQVLDRANHLAAIHKAPSSEWTWLVQSLLASKWSVKQTESAVKAIAGLTIDPRLNDWLKPVQCWTGFRQS